jgi:hypothetical protein
VIRSLVIAACLLMLVPARAHAAGNMELALQDDNVFLDSMYMSQAEGLNRAVDLDVSRIRVNVLWSRSLVAGSDSRKKPAAPVYDFSKIDALEKAAAARGIQLQLTIAGPAPAWATGNHKVGPYRPNPTLYAQFVRTVVEHFQGRIDRYSLWNEPNWDTWLAPAKSAPAIYRHLYAAGYDAVKTTDPDAQVLFGELAPIGEPHAIAPVKFLRQLFSTGARLKADGLAVHPYQFTIAPNLPGGKADDVTIGTLGHATAELDALAKAHELTTPRGRPLDLYLTEFGYLSQGHRALKPKVRASYLKAAVNVARRNPRVRELLQFQLIDPPAEVRWHSALLDPDGHPLPAYAALLHR